LILAPSEKELRCRCKRRSQKAAARCGARAYAPGCLLPTRALTGEEIEIISDSVRLDVTGHRVDFKAAQRE